MPQRALRLLLSLMAAIASLGWPAAASAQTWGPPAGVPWPSFGINEVSRPDPAPWSGAVSGFYYVCPTCSGATDSGNANGYPARPRSTVPNPIPAGSVVRLGGRIDNLSVLTANGTASAPVFVRGIPQDRPTITREVETLNSHYLIVEYTQFLDRGDGSAGRIFLSGDHVTVRRSEFSGNQNRAGGLFVESGSHHVVYANYLHDMGNLNDTGDQDSHCMGVGPSSQIWIVDNEMARCSGDGMQINAGFNNNAGLHHIYVGRNYSHHNKQAGFGLKNASDVIFSENVVHDHRNSSSSPGACVVMQYGPQRTWAIFNTFYGCDWGVSFNSTSGLGDGTDVFLVGNVVHSIANACFNFYNDSVVNRHVVNNTCAGAAGGVRYDGSVGTIDIQNNIFYGISGQQIQVEGSAPASSGNSSAHHNLFASPFRVRWGGTNYTSLAAWQNATPHGDDSLVGDPVFANSATADLRPLVSGAGNDRGQADADGVYSAFQSLYGIDIQVDRNRSPRARGAGWDMGAYEFDAGAPPVPLPTPTPGPGPTPAPAPNPTPTPTPGLTLTTTVSQSSFSAGNLMTLSATLRATSAPSQFDAYVVVQFPSGQLYSWTGNGLVPGLEPLAMNLPPVNWTGIIAQLSVPAGISPGRYKWLSGLAQPGTFNMITPIAETAFEIK